MDASYADEKIVTKHIDDIERLESSIDTAAERRLVRKMDIWILPLVTLLFLLNFIDRAAVGNANVAGLSRDLKLSAAKYEYNIALMAFYIFYIIVEPPSNLMMKKYGSLWLSFLVVGFGVITIATAFVHNFGQFLAVRILLGCFEGGVIPAIAFLLSRFYRRHELVFRIGIFLALGPTLSGAFGGLLAAGLVNGTSIGSVTGWRKIFLVEGIITTGCGFLSALIIPTSPETAKFFNETERELAVRRLASEHIGKQTGGKSDKRAIKQGFANTFTWIACFAYGFINIPVQGTSIFLPTILRGIYPGISQTALQLRSVPPYIVSCAWTLSIAYLCQRTRRHGVFIAGSLIPTVIGYVIFVAAKNPSVLYFASFLTYSGAVPCGPIFLSWAAANASPETSRAITTALVPGVGTWGSIVATWAYAKGAPRYVPGNALNVGGACTAIMLALFLRYYAQRENKLRDEGRRDHRLEGLNQDQIDALGNRHPQFRYLL